MKVTFTPASPQPEIQLPFIATYCDILVLVTAKGETHSSGYMISENSAHTPFKYFTDDWRTADLKPFHGTITITCP
jgi:hypothetical protein